MEKTTNKVTTEMLLNLYKEMNDLYPDTTLKEFEEIIQMDGYWDTKTRLSIVRETEHWLDNIGGREKLQLLYRQYKNGTLGDKINKQKQRWRKLLDTSKENRKD